MTQREKTKSSGVTLTELLVVISIVVILMTIMAFALGAFTHTSRVDMAANTLATAFREARFYAMNKNVSVIPLVLRDTQGQLTVVYAAKALHFRGTLDTTSDPPLLYEPAEKGKTQNPWTLTLKGVDGSSLVDGCFVLMVGAPTIDLNNLGADQAYYELMHMKVTPPADQRLLTDPSQYTFEIQARGVHNTARGTFNPGISTAMLGTDGYVVVSGTNTGERIAQTEAREFTLSGFCLPDNIMVDQVPGAEDSNAGPVKATIIAQAAIFQEDGSLLPDGGKHLPANHFPVFLPIFLPDGRVGSAIAGDVAGALEVRHYHGKAPYADRTLRVTDVVSREVRYVTVTLNGMVYVSQNVPTGYGREEGDPGIPDYVDVYDPSSSTASSTSSSTSSTNSSTSNSTSTTSSTTSSTSSSTSSTSASTSSSTGTGSTTSASSSASSSTASSTTSATSSNSSTTSSNSSSTASSTSSNSSASSSTSASTSSSTGTGSSTSSTSASSSASSSTSNSTTASSSNSASTTSSASTSGTPPSSSSTSAGGTSTGGGRF